MPRGGGNVAGGHQGRDSENLRIAELARRTLLPRRRRRRVALQRGLGHRVARGAGIQGRRQRVRIPGGGWRAHDRRDQLLERQRARAGRACAADHARHRQPGRPVPHAQARRAQAAQARRRPAALSCRDGHGPRRDLPHRSHLHALPGREQRRLRALGYTRATAWHGTARSAHRVA